MSCALCGSSGPVESCVCEAAPVNRARAIAEAFAIYADALDDDPEAACGPLVDWFWNLWVKGTGADDGG